MKQVKQIISQFKRDQPAQNIPKSPVKVKSVNTIVLTEIYNIETKLWNIIFAEMAKIQIIGKN